MNNEFCPVCSGEPTLLGGLGRLTWFRCRCCGWEWSVTKLATGLVDAVENDEVER